jgi:hypothetical protein
MLTMITDTNVLSGFFVNFITNLSLKIFSHFIIIIYFQILKLHMVLFKLEMIQANTTLFFTEKKNHTNKANTFKLP